MVSVLRRAAIFIVLAAFPAMRGQPDPAAGPGKIFGEIDAILDELSQITGLKKTRPVRSAIITRDELKKFLEKRINDVVDPKELRAEEIALRKFGFVPEGFDLKSNTVELMTEQAAAFYDYREKKLYLLEGGSDEFQQPALVHELAHALADQHFSLEKFVNPNRSDDS